MKSLFVNIPAETVTINNETCNFYESGLYVNDDSQIVNGKYPSLTDKDEIEEALIERYDGEEIEVIFE